jgi:hypothetical protein
VLVLTVGRRGSTAAQVWVHDGVAAARELAQSACQIYLVETRWVGTRCAKTALCTHNYVRITKRELLVVTM